MGRMSTQYYPGKTRMRTYRGGFGDCAIYQGCSGDWSDIKPTERCQMCKRVLNSKNHGLCNICGTHEIRSRNGTIELSEVEGHVRYVRLGLQEYALLIEKIEKREKDQGQEE